MLQFSCTFGFRPESPGYGVNMAARAGLPSWAVDIDSKAIERNVAIALLVDISFSRAEHTGWEFRMIRDGVEAFLRATFLVKSDSEAFVGAGHEDGRSGIDAGDEHGQDGGWRPFWLCLAGLKIMIGM